MFLGFSFLFVREDRQNDLYFFRVNIRFVIMLLFSTPSARESRRDFVYLCNKTF
nr:MAG TPA: hypothetical protein [Caudoviricetes sp.]